MNDLLMHEFDSMQYIHKIHYLMNELMEYKHYFHYEYLFKQYFGFEERNELLFDCL